MIFRCFWLFPQRSDAMKSLSGSALSLRDTYFGLLALRKLNGSRDHLSCCCFLNGTEEFRNMSDVSDHSWLNNVPTRRGVHKHRLRAPSLSSLATSSSAKEVVTARRAFVHDLEQRESTVDRDFARTHEIRCLTQLSGSQNGKTNECGRIIRREIFPSTKLQYQQDNRARK